MAFNTSCPLVVLVAAAVVACRPETSGALSTQPLTDFPYATARPDCAPWDGAAVSILFTVTADTTEPVATPFVRVALYDSPDRLVHRTIRWPGDAEVGAASRCPTDGDCARAESGVVRLEGFQGDSVLPGRLRLTFPDHTVLDGAFRAVWRPRPALCG